MYWHSHQNSSMFISMQESFSVKLQKDQSIKFVFTSNVEEFSAKQFRLHPLDLFRMLVLDHHLNT